MLTCFSYSYGAELVQKLLHEKNSPVVTFDLIFRYNDVLSISNNNFYSYVDSIYPRVLEIKDTTECSMRAKYLNILLNTDINGKLTVQLYYKRDDINFSIVIFPYLSSNIYHHHLNMLCLSHISLETLEHVLHMITF